MTERIRDALFAMQDPGYREFQARLMPTVKKERIIGVRIPALRRYAKGLAGTEEAKRFMEELPHAYYEEDNLHAFLIEQLGELEATVEVLDRFLPYVDNWATCDSTSPRCFSKYPQELLPHALRWMAAEEPYAVRFGIGVLMKHYLGAHFCDDIPARVASVQREEYYINMMVAWYFATALAVRYDEILPYIKERRLRPWIHQKTIQKAVESNRLTREQKNELRQFR